MWDITKLKGSQTWTYFHLYLSDPRLYRRHVVGWMVVQRESAILADPLITKTYRKQDITPETLALHADRGSAMTSKTVALLLADLGQ